MEDFFKAMSANDTIKDASNVKQPRKLWGEYWIENEVCCLFADSNLGKSILAVQIADHVANLLHGAKTVLYYDFELSRKQFEMRYYDNESKEHYHFNDGLIRVELDTEKVKDYCKSNDATLDGLLLQGIENNIVQYNAAAVIVDNISWLVNMRSASSLAGKLMMRLCELKRKYGISILILAHTPKRNLTRPITQNDLSGTKNLVNFFDSMFAVGKCAANPSARYVKQIKVRSGAFKNDSNHVEVCTIAKENGFLHFKHVGYATEMDQLSDNTRKPLIPMVVRKQKKIKVIKPPKKGRNGIGKAIADSVAEMAMEEYRTINGL